MKELKFNCPSCGQHIQCDWGHAGENIPCPSCAALIRVPLDGDWADAPAPSPANGKPSAQVTGEGEKVSYAAPKMEHGPGPEQSAAPAPVSAAVPAAPVAHISELHCVCPVCQSELRISVAPGPLPRGTASPAGPLPDIEPLALDERERQIAAARARAFHPASAKPRLDRILDSTMVGPFSPTADK